MYFLAITVDVVIVYAVFTRFKHEKKKIKSENADLFPPRGSARSYWLCPGSGWIPHGVHHFDGEQLIRGHPQEQH
jgi:hypothetical protein